jgi:hypothetical protein
MAIPALIIAAITGAAGGLRKETIAVTVALLQTGKVTEGFGYSDGSEIPAGGSRSPTTLGGLTVLGIYHDTLATPDLFEIALSGTGGNKNQIKFMDVVTDSGTVRLTTDANTTFNDSGSRMLWTWNATDHAIPDWISDFGNTNDVSVYFTSLG